jgi:tRNA wybutosine-synthesizing protein 1
VYRLTLVAGWNASDAAEYAKLIDLGKPDLIEIKGMTYCGATSGASNLTMKNVPYHEDVKKFGEALCTARLDLVSGRDAASTSTSTPTELATTDEPEPKTGGTPRSAEYGLACEHAHSCCILLARKDPYLVDGKWHTWIDYEKFQDAGGLGRAVHERPVHAPHAALVRVGRRGGGFRPGRDARAQSAQPPGEGKERGRVSA